MEIKKDISYLGKDFGQIKQNLIDFTKQYFPETYTNFSPENPGSIFMEMAAYVGDVLSYYADSNLKESLMLYADEKSNVYNLAQQLGYIIKPVTPAYTDVNVYQLVPSMGSGDNNKPDYDYTLTIKPGMQINHNDNIATFRTLDSIDFGISSSINNTEVTIYEVDDVTNEPTYYLLKKSARVVSGTVKKTIFSFGSPIPYDKVVLSDTNIVDILSVEESDGDNWYQVPYLAQDTIFEELPNIAENDPELSQYRGSVSSLLKLRVTSKRYVTRQRKDGKLELQFGSGISDNNDEVIIPNPSNVGNGLAAFNQAVSVDIDPSNFLYTGTYGLAPSNTTLTITYTVGNGISDNVESNTLTKINLIEFIDNINSTLSAGAVNFIKRSVSVINPDPAIGATTNEDINNIKNSAMAYFSTQNRAVHERDYIIRSYSLPAKFGSVAKAYIIADNQISQQELQRSSAANPLALNLYTLGYNASKQLTPLNTAIKTNLMRYLDYYRIATDAINIKDSFIINIGLRFSITVLQNYNSNEVLVNVINTLIDYLNIDNWQINQPIIKSEVINLIGNTKGIQNVVSVRFENKYDSELGYSGNIYDLDTATRNGIIYPSLDPSIFEVKFPNKDISGQVVN